MTVTQADMFVELVREEQLRRDERQAELIVSKLTDAMLAVGILKRK